MNPRPTTVAIYVWHPVTRYSSGHFVVTVIRRGVWRFEQPPEYLCYSIQALLLPVFVSPQ